MIRGESDSDPRIAEQAARWLIELEEGGPEALEQFARWLKVSPVHVQEFLLVSSVWKEFDGFDAERRVSVERLLEQGGQNVAVLEPAAETSGATKPRHIKRRRTLVGFAFAAALWAAWAVLSFLQGSPDTYATGTGEQRAFKLDDGSVVHLNTQSRVVVQFSKGARTVRLLEGEAMFTVERDPSRPFRVVADDAVIQAVGTQFNVYHRTEGTTVSVVEGVVQVLSEQQERREQVQAPRRFSGSAAASDRTEWTSAARITGKSARIQAGEQAQVSPSGRIVTQPVMDLDQVVAWRQRRLVFRGASLEDVAREFNRYNDLQIQLDGADVRAKRLTGVFDADDPDALILFLAEDHELAIAKDAHAVTIRRR